MVELQTVDVSRLIDERRINAFNIKLLLLSFLLVLLDGYDITAAAFAAPYLVSDWHITSMSALGPVFSASLLGVFFGSPLFGYIGDRFGRKVAIIASCLMFGAFTLACTKAGAVSELLYLRFLAGIGIGGLLPNITALNGEFAPRRIRATMIIVMFTGIAFGGALPGLISTTLVPHYGWQVLFHIGGVAPIMIAFLAIYLLPESLKFLVLKNGSREAIVSIVRSLNPALGIGPRTAFVIKEEAGYSGFTPKLLFAGRLAYLTPLLWAMFICCQMTFYFTNSWLPTVLAAAHVPASHAALATSIFQIGGMIGGLALARPLDKVGFTPVAVLFALSLPIVGSLGFLTSMEPALMTAVFFAGFCLLGLQLGLNAASVLIYPTAFRANGSGWAFAIGRIGSVSGPVLGGLLLARDLPLHQIFMLLLIPLGIGTVASVAMARQFGTGFQDGGRQQLHTSNSATTVDDPVH
ncbi:MFS transporter [Variovorax sp. E3]|uniref:MFS transporter n=1 Tax=Variovorax sp. E3 TaxID=1914993 RepID=UPI0018DEBAFC|nr:MFS transporter [Variovorax sp. E3]